MSGLVVRAWDAGDGYVHRCVNNDKTDIPLVSAPDVLAALERAIGHPTNYAVVVALDDVIADLRTITGETK